MKTTKLNSIITGMKFIELVLLTFLLSVLIILLSSCSTSYRIVMKWDKNSYIIENNKTHEVTIYQSKDTFTKNQKIKIHENLLSKPGKEYGIDFMELLPILLLKNKMSLGSVVLEKPISNKDFKSIDFSKQILFTLPPINN